MKIYTRTGDRGRTGLFSGERVGKADPRVEAYGTVDELNAVLGMLAAAMEGDAGGVERVQSDLFRIGAWFATTPGTAAFEDLPALGPGAIRWLETEIDRLESELPALRGFILPGGHPAAACAHLARTVCRRAERQVVAFLLDAGEDRAPEAFARALVYLNRLSDYLFVLARDLNRRDGRGDRLWEPGERG